MELYTAMKNRRTRYDITNASPITEECSSMLYGHHFHKKDLVHHFNTIIRLLTMM